MTSSKIPTPEIVDKAVASMVRFEQQRYFFERLNNPGWLAALNKKGFFSTPPATKRDEERGTVEFRQWPALKYLSRMAAHEPITVSEIMLKVPDSDNPFIVTSFLEAALSMPSDVAAELIPKIATMIRSPYVTRGHQAGELAVHLAKGGKHKAALTLLNSALEVVPDPRPVSEELKAADPEYRHEARTRMTSYEYQWILQRNGTALVESIGAPFVSLLNDLLETALGLEERPREHDGKTIEDYSYIWRPSLSSGETTESPKRFLVPAVLQAAEQFSSLGSQQLGTIRKLLLKKRFKVFERIELEIITKHLDFSGSAIADRLTDKATFDDFGLRYEYNALSQAAFGLLDAPRQNQILQWIDEGSDGVRLLERGYSQEEAGAIIDNWRLERLAPINQFLPKEWKERYETLKEKFGEPEPGRRARVRGGAYALGSKSPKPTEEMEGMSVESVINFLKTWRPENEPAFFPFSPSEEGLGAVLTAIVAKNPSEFSSQIAALKDADPTYVRGAIQGFESAIRSKSAFDWNNVLGLCSWVITQPIKIPDRTGDHWTKDPDWGWTRQAIVSFIENGLKEKEIPFSLRQQVWSVISSLAEADVSDDVAYNDPDSLSKDIWSYSVNRTEARATRVAIQYIEWCRNNLAQPRFSLADVPEVEALMSSDLDPEKQPSLDIRLVYGEFLPFLINVDREWVEKNKSRIFPGEAEKRPLRDVAWVAYLVANYAYDAAFDVLFSFYLDAVRNELGTPRQVGSGHMMYNPDENLVHHLMQLYWRGRIDLAENGILDEFLRRASDELLGTMVTYLGRSLKDTNEKLEDGAKDRLKALWTRSLVSSDAPVHKREMSAYGWWFNSYHFEDDWSLEQFYKSLQLSKGATEPKIGTLERLAKLAGRFPALVIACTQLIINADFENVVLWTDDLKTILKTALKSGNNGTTRIARDIIQSLGVRGYHEYRVLLI
jgi:hypothetical protein